MFKNEFNCKKLDPDNFLKWIEIEAKRHDGDQVAKDIYSVAQEKALKRKKPIVQMKNSFRHKSESFELNELGTKQVSQLLRA